MRDLGRLLRPASIAVIGGGAWGRAVVKAARGLGFSGEVFVVHPNRPEIPGAQTVARIEDLPRGIDAAFVGINRLATIEAVDALRQHRVGGAVCFASGFAEADAEDGGAADLQARLVAAAGDMPILGPNCYGMINALDGAALWPDVHGCEPVNSGVAILTQSSNIAINLTQQQRALPIAYAVTCGNMAQTAQAEIASAMLDDPRVTAIGLHVEGFGDLRGWEAFARRAWDRQVPVVILKVGRSAQASAGTISHTASLAGSHAGAGALMSRLGFAAVDELPTFLETLKLFHVQGPLEKASIATISCSGGEASLIADTAFGLGLDLPALNDGQTKGLRQALGPMVALANPLDYHTYIWRDADRMTDAWAAMAQGPAAITLSIVDFPPQGDPAWDCTVSAALGARTRSDKAFAVVSSLPELMPRDIAATLMQGGVVPMNGLREALSAIHAAATTSAPDPRPVLLPGSDGPAHTLSEDEAKAEFDSAGIPTPRRILTHRDDIGTAAKRIGGRLVLKSVGPAHKSDAGGVRTELTLDTITDAAIGMPGETFLIEEMIDDCVAELLLGVTRDPAHGFVLTIGAGGVLTEIMDDAVSVLVPSSRDTVKHCLSQLKSARLLNGYRGAALADIDALLDVIDALQGYVLANADTLHEAEINPVICTPTRAVAVDALIRKGRL
ncbi:acetate--CoA ligase family protein [Shimia biformata]|uniref:acetate--CoA ligase family protein n=1 Tax=Shimia biformata TaxID=1294299 RepID=UPI0030840883